MRTQRFPVIDQSCGHDAKMSSTILIEQNQGLGHSDKVRTRTSIDISAGVCFLGNDVECEITPWGHDNVLALEKKTIERVSYGCSDRGVLVIL